MKLATFCTELVPLLCLPAGLVAALSDRGPWPMRLAGALLLATALGVLALRIAHRRAAPGAFDDFALRKPRSESFFKRFEQHW